MELKTTAKKTYLYILSGALTLLILLLAFGSSIFSVGCGQKATDFSVVNNSGKTVRLSDFEGTPVVVNFWASWCPPCKAELPDFDEAYHKYKGKVKFMMVNLTNFGSETRAKAENFLEQNNYDFPVYFDTKSNAENAYNVQAIPLTLFIDENGKLVRSYNQMISGSLLEAYIQDIL